MVQCLGGGTVSVLVDGQAVHEYVVKEEKGEKVKTFTCFIEAKEGIEYEVKVDNFPMIKQGKFRATVFVDGREADRYIQCAFQSGPLRKHSKNQYTFAGFLSTNGEGQDVLRAFTFSKIDATDDETARSLSKKRLGLFCTIRVEIVQAFRKGGVRHDYVTRSNLQRDLPMNPVVHDDTKPALLGLNTGFGQEKADAEGITCRCIMNEEIAEEKMVVIFNYRPAFWLEDVSLKYTPQHDAVSDSEDDDGDCGFEIDIERTEAAAQSLARQKEEEGLMAQQRSVRIKMEAPMEAEPPVIVEATEVQPMSEEVEQENKMEKEAEEKSEVEVKIEVKMEEENRDTKEYEVFDLTGDGEFVFPSRKVGDTIVIEDE